MLVVDSHAEFKELIRAARMLKNCGRYEPIFLMDMQSYSYDREIAVCQEEGILYCHGSNRKQVRKDTSQFPINARAGNPLQRWGQLRQRFRDFGSNPVRRFLRRVFNYARRKVHPLVWLPFTLLSFWVEIKRARQTINDQKPCFLVLSKDGHQHVAFLVRAAHDCGVPAVVVPYAMGSATQSAEMTLNIPSRSLKRWDNRLVSTIYPKWLKEHRGHKVLAKPATEILAMEWLKLAPPLPWVTHSGHADFLAVENKHMWRIYQRAGLPLEKLVLTGALYDDVLAENMREAVERRKALYQELDLPADRPMVLCDVPANQFFAENIACDFTNYDELVQFWVQTVSALKDYNVILSLHPRLRYEEMRYLEQYGGRISRRDTAALIPLAEFYVSTASSTIRWAIACRKSVVDYDVYKYEWPEYREAGGVLSVRTREEFVSVLQKLAYDRKFYTDTVSRQAVCSEEWAEMDGHAANRMLRLFDDISARPASQIRSPKKRRLWTKGVFSRLASLGGTFSQGGR